MPEIPEMEVYKNFLIQSVVGKDITRVNVHRNKSVNIDPEIFSRHLLNKQIIAVIRRAKHLYFDIGEGLYLITHLMLDGRLYYQPGGNLKPGHTFPIDLPGKPHIELVFFDDSILYFCDLRLGYLHLVNQEVLNGILASLGVEPLSKEYNWPVFQELMAKRRGMIKPLLMNQKVIAGIGNAYSNEILFEAKVLPDRPVASFSEEELQHLYQSIPRVLTEALQKGGYIEEPFAPWDNLSGGAIPTLKVYDRAGEPCFRCGTSITVKEISGRKAFFCPVCQD